MKPTVLLYNFTDPERKMKIQQALMPLGFRLKAVKKEEYGLPVGILAGVKELENEKPEGSENMDFSDEMAVMAGFTSAQIDAFIYSLRKKGVGRIDYKAVLTKHNMKWNSVKLYQEIKREHEAMKLKAVGNAVHEQ